MPATSLIPTPPDNMPIWARLQLITQNVPFTDVKTWNYETATRIVAFLDSSRYVFLYRR